jgi:hypothetical protein
MKHDLCPLCGQRMLIRHGVALSPRQADIFDLIENSGERGVLNSVLAWVFYSDKSERAARQLLAVTIHQINAVLASTDAMIKSAGNGTPYKVTRRIAL